MHGDADPLVPYDQSTRLHEALTKAGVPNELITVRDGGRGDFSPAEAQRVATALRAFLARNGVRPVGQ